MEEKAEQPAELALDYTFTADDIANYYEDYQVFYRQNPGKRRSQWMTYTLYYAGMLAVPLLAFLLTIAVSSIGIAILVLTGASVLWSNLFPDLWTRYSLYRLRQTESFMGEQQTIISKEGITNRNATLAWTLYWPQVEDIVVGQHHLLMVIDRKDHRVVFPIPRHAFANTNAMWEFVKQATEYWKQGAVPQLPASPETDRPPKAIEQ